MIEGLIEIGISVSKSVTGGNSAVTYDGSGSIKTNKIMRYIDFVSGLTPHSSSPSTPEFTAAGFTFPTALEPPSRLIPLSLGLKMRSNSSPYGR